MTTTLAAAASASAPALSADQQISGQNRVVVGMDDDPVSVDALRFAATEAAYRGCDLLAVHVWHYPAMWGYPVWPEQTDLGTYILQTLQETVRGVLAERAAAGEPVVAMSVEVLQGVTAAALHDLSHGANLLVLGARHHNHLVGSISRACSNHPLCPVVIVPAPQA